MDMQHGAVGWLPQRTADLVRSAAAAAKERLGEDFVAALLVGNALHPERADRGLRPQLLLVARSLPPTSLAGLASSLKSSIREGVRPRTVTVSELERGADVFALELAEWKARHWLVDGTDPLGTIEIAPANLRHAIEFQLRGLGRRLRNRVLVGLSGHGREDTKRAIFDAMDALSVACHHALVCWGEEPPSFDAEVLRAIAKRSEADASHVVTLFNEVQKTGRIGSVEQALAALLPFIELVTEAVDQIED